MRVVINVPDDWEACRGYPTLEELEEQGAMNNDEQIKKTCENCIEWEWFEGCGYGCFVMRTMIPLDANACPNYFYKWRPCKEGGEQE